MPRPSSSENYLRLLVTSAIVVKFLVNNVRLQTALDSFLGLHCDVCEAVGKICKEITFLFDS